VVVLVFGNSGSEFQRATITNTIVLPMRLQLSER
jgi:hypothetical protein